MVTEELENVLDEELLEELNDMLESGCGCIEVLEWLQDNTDLDPFLYISKLF